MTRAIFAVVTLQADQRGAAAALRREQQIAVQLRAAFRDFSISDTADGIVVQGRNLAARRAANVTLHFAGRTGS